MTRKSVDETVKTRKHEFTTLTRLDPVREKTVLEYIETTIVTFTGVIRKLEHAGS